MKRRTSSPSRSTLAISFTAALALAACTTATPYQPIGTRGASGGYASQQIEDNRYRVSFAGNQFTSRERVENYLLYRAAELAVQQGYNGFTIVQRATDRDVETNVSRDPFGPGPYGYWSPYWRYSGPWGWRSWDPWYGDPFFSSSVDVRTIDRYEAHAEIVMYRGTRPNNPYSFDARQVMRNLGPSIELPR